MNPWQILGIEPTTDKRAIKRAYASKLKIHKPELDPEGYQRLRAAFDTVIKQSLTPARAAAEHLTQADPVEPEPAEQTFSQPDRALTTPPPSPSKPRTTQQRPHDAEQAKLKSQQLHQEKRQKQQQRIEDAVKKAVKQIIGYEESYDAITNFNQHLSSELFQPISHRRLLESSIFRAAIEWPRGRVFLSQFFDHAANIFGWRDELPADPYIRQHLDYFCGRIKVGLEYQNLVDKAWGMQSAKTDKKERGAAQIILGEHAPGRFRVVGFFNRYYHQLKNIVDNFNNDQKLALCPEIDTPTFRWWQSHYARYPFTISHVFFGFLAAFFVTAGILDVLTTLQPPLVILAMFAGAFAICSVISWWLLKIMAIGWKKIVLFYKTRWQTIAQQHWFFWPVSVIYFSLFIYAGVQDDKLIQFLLFLLASVLAFSVIGVGLIIACFGATAFAVLESNIANVTLPNFLDNAFILVGITTYFIWFHTLVRLDIKALSFFTRNFFGIVVFQALLACILGYGLLEAVRYWQV